MSKETGIKHDLGKPQMELLSSIALIEVSKVMSFGARKYTAHNWRGGIAWSRILGASLRHIFSFIGGEDTDPETGLSHVAHAMCCLMFLLEYTVTHKQLDDRYKPLIENEIQLSNQRIVSCPKHPYDPVEVHRYDTHYEYKCTNCNEGLVP